MNGGFFIKISSFCVCNQSVFLSFRISMAFLSCFLFPRVGVYIQTPTIQGRIQTDVLHVLLPLDVLVFWDGHVVFIIFVFACICRSR